MKDGLLERASVLLMKTWLVMNEPLLMTTVIPSKSRKEVLVCSVVMRRIHILLVKLRLLMNLTRGSRLTF